MISKKALIGSVLAIALLLLGATVLDVFGANLDAFSCGTVTEIPQVECEALVAFYNSANGASWSNNSGWMDTSTPCDWYGVTCQGGHVTQIELDKNQLNGSIPPELGNLVYLQRLNLRGNQQLTGAIPPELGNLVNLQELNLWGTSKSGNIPPELGNLINLQYLLLYGGTLTGDIPPELGNLTNLRELILSSNHLSGSIPVELGNLVNLRELHLHSNWLNGDIPAELGNLVNLRNLHMTNNRLSGSIPPELGNMASLQHLQLYNNRLTGSIPPQLGNLASLKKLSLNRNQLSGSIPPELGNLADLEELYLNSNQFSGALPGTLTNLVNLDTFYFHDTDLCEPSDAAFQTWLASISDLRSTGVTCPTPPPKELKQAAIDVIEDYLGSDGKWLDDRVEKAIEYVQKSLAEELWETDETLTNKGKKVFDEEKKAAKELMKILDKEDVGSDVKSAAQASIDHLLTADETLASTAIEDAIAALEAVGCDAESSDRECQKALREMAKAQEEMAKAQDEYDRGKYDKAIGHYEKAWEHAQKAVKKAPASGAS